MNCEAFEELAGAYVLGALTVDEQRLAEAHLATCALHPEVIGLKVVAASLVLAVPEMEPPATLKPRLMEAVGPSLQASETVARAIKWGPWQMIRSWLFAPRAPYALAAAMSVLVAGLLVWNVSLQSGDDTGAGGETLVTQLSGAGITGRVVYVPGDDLAVMTVQGLDPLPSDRTYQVWAMEDGVATGIGFLITSNGRADTLMRVDLTTADAVAVTVEPFPGSDQPTTEPIISADL